MPTEMLEQSRILPRISPEEFRSRIQRIQAAMLQEKCAAVLVYGDEYRKENLRYVSNFWPIFERGLCLIPQEGEPTYCGAPEGESYAREMCVWPDIRNLPECAAVTVPENIDYPQSKYSRLKDVLGEILKGGKRLGIVGLSDMPSPILERIKKSVPNLEIVDSAPLLFGLRIIKSPMEIACLAEAGRIVCAGYEHVLRTALPGNTELMVAGAAEGACRSAGAETIIFSVMGSGPRTDTVIGRPVNRVIQNGDMFMASIAVQYEGYVATAEFPFVAGRASNEQKRFLRLLLDAAHVQLTYLNPGVVTGTMVRAVRDVFRKHHLEKYDLYPPMHGIGLAEAESPYPDEKSTYPFQAGMCVNSDISLFRTPVHSNRLEEGFIITESGPRSITPYIRNLAERGQLCTDEINGS